MLYDWRDRIDAGTLLGPRMIVASQIIDGDPTLWDPNLLHVLVVDDAAAARAAVRQVKAESADFVKVYSRLTKTAYAAILDEARKVGLTVHGHGPARAHLERGQQRRPAQHRAHPLPRPLRLHSRGRGTADGPRDQREHR
jgi:hypothetical protein